MINKIMTPQQAVAGVEDGMTIMVGGFLATGSPEILMDALVEKGVKHLTVIGNDGGLAEGQPAGEFAGKTSRGIGKLLDNHMVDHIIASHLGVNPRLNEQFAEGTLRYTLVPQGTLAEKIRAATYGYTRTANYKIFLQSLFQHTQFAQDALLANHGRNLGDGGMVAHQCHAHTLAGHHHQTVLPRLNKNRIKVFGMSRESELFTLYIGFIDRCRHQCLCLTGFQVLTSTFQTHKRCFTGFGSRFAEVDRGIVGIAGN